MYYVLQYATFAVLVLAANTAFADFPRLASILANERYLPRQLAARGDRLAFSNGIVALALVAMLLVWIFHGDTTALIPLYAIGVFVCFTLSQAGMVVHWIRTRAEAGTGRRPSTASVRSRRRRLHHPGRDQVHARRLDRRGHHSADHHPVAGDQETLRSLRAEIQFDGTTE